MGRSGWVRIRDLQERLKKGIFQAKNTDPDLKKLYEVKDAVEKGSLGTGVDNLKKFNKFHMLYGYTMTLN